MIKQKMRVWSAFVVMFVSILIGIVLSMSLGLTADILHESLTAANVYDVPPEWSSHNLVKFLLQLMYLCIYIIPLLGITLFILACVHRQRYDVYEQEEETNFYMP